MVSKSNPRFSAVATALLWATTPWLLPVADCASQILVGRLVQSKGNEDVTSALGKQFANGYPDALRVFFEVDDDELESLWV